MKRLDRWTKTTVDTHRRQFLRTAGVAGTVVVAGCIGDDDADDAPDPIAIESDHDCAVCSMVIESHPGPSGHAFYDDDDLPSAEDGVVHYCSSACAYEYYFDQLEAGYEPIVLYLTDYSAVDWELTDEQGIEFISAHLEAEANASATDLEFVVDSDVFGAMGESLIGFTSAEDADAFAEAHGGERFDHDSVTRELIDSLGT
ncbi:nitrous oxide reductase accessory protein NosL [Natronorubrum sulfidifaciens]|uniref:Lipoprotein NosL n=1 Tax=Natronorubrum sulfidifaciens JCM 14089 TaxID=1230460 RepID=L9W4Q2_9EURY|nr:nitrous oxide reductase accessory protein NosL [Natronorubrum sulfidifaciens]ELY44271.1 lipoprotein NosL [Natronorubrum sulfidifaciens JCM 14089]